MLDATCVSRRHAFFVIGDSRRMEALAPRGRSRLPSGAVLIEDEARKLDNTNFIVSGRFKPHAVRDGSLITGQQQYSGRAAARLMIETLGT